MCVIRQKGFEYESALRFGLPRAMEFL